MRLLTKLLVAVPVLLLIATSPSAQQTPPLAFGVLNQQSPALTAERWNPILSYASTVSGVPLQLKMGRTVQDTNAMMARGELDFVFTNHNFQTEFDTIGFKGSDAAFFSLVTTSTSGGEYSPGTVSVNRIQNVTQQGSMGDMKRQAVTDGMRPLRLAGALRVAEGLTTMEEVLTATPPLE